MLAGEVPTYDLPRDLVLHGNPDEWMERIRISVNITDLQPDPKVQRAVKDRSHAAMTRYFEQWRADKDDFLAHLVGLEEQAGLEHVRLVADVYGDDWSVPYRGILVHERERQGRAACARRTHFGTISCDLSSSHYNFLR